MRISEKSKLPLSSVGSKAVEMARLEDEVKREIDRFCEAALRRGLSPVTVKNYRSDLQGVVDYFSQSGKHLVWSEFFAVDLDEYRCYLSESVRGTTANRKLAGLRAFLKWFAVESKHVISEPLPELRRIIPKPAEWVRPRWLTLGEQAALTEVVRATANEQDHALIALLLHAGIRTSQLGRLKWSDLRISGNSGSVSVFRPAHDDHIEIPMNRFVRDAILALGYMKNKGSSEMVFEGRSGPMSRRRVEMMVRQFGERAHIADLTPLVLRNTFIANMLRLEVHPVAIADVMGDPALDLLRYFTPYRQQDMELAVEEIVDAILDQDHSRLKEPQTMFPFPLPLR